MDMLLINPMPFIMSSCGVCLETLHDPVSLPCGHIFCDSCITRVVQVLESHSLLHRCPVCSATYSVVNVDLSLVPVSLRPFITPNIRRLYPRNGKEEPVSQAPRHTPESEIAALRAENSALKNNTALWRQRAEVHASATLGLLSLVRSTQLHAANSLKAKKDAECQISTLKRKIEDVEQLYRCSLQRDLQVSHDDYHHNTPASARQVFVRRRPYTPSSSSSSSDSDFEFESCCPLSKRARTSSPDSCVSGSPLGSTSKSSPVLRKAPWEL